MTQTLLPSNRTPLEQSLDLAGGDRLDALNPEIIKTAIDPMTIPAALLPWLAWGLRVDFWNDKWSIERKRYVVSQSVANHRLKGTLQGITNYLALADAKLIDAILPPAKTFLTPKLTEAERAAYLARFPQLRIYPYVARDNTCKYAHFTSKAFGLSKAFLSDPGSSLTSTSFPTITHSYGRYTRVSTLWDRGVETNLTFRNLQIENPVNLTAVEYDEVILPGVPSSEIFPNTAPKAKQYFGEPYDPSHFVRVPRALQLKLDVGKVTYTTINPGLGLIDVDYENVFQVHPAQKGSLFAGRFLPGVNMPKLTLPQSDAWRNLFQRWYLLDPTRVPDSRKRYTHLAFTRLGMPVYNAELKVSIPGKAYPREAWRFVSGFLRDPGETAEQVSDALMAVRVSKSLRDKVLVNTKTQRVLRASDLVRVGSGIRVGSLVAS